MSIYSNFKIYGPYTRKDGRQHVCLVDKTIRLTVSYPKFLVEFIMDHCLKSDEVVHHLDGDFTNNNLDNLAIMKRSKHTTSHQILNLTKTFVCPNCKKSFSLTGKRLHDAFWSSLRHNNGPFCSRHCAGKFSTTQMSLDGEIHQVEPAKTAKPIINGNAVLGCKTECRDFTQAIPCG